MSKLFLIIGLAEAALEAYKIYKADQYRKELRKHKELYYGELLKGPEKWDRNVMDYAEYNLMLVGDNVLGAINELRQEDVGPVS